jgi:hypothetical protein
VLKVQHHRGREVTEYTLALTGNGAIGSGDAKPLARAIESFVLTKTIPSLGPETGVFRGCVDLASGAVGRDAQGAATWG